MAKTLKLAEAIVQVVSSFCSANNIEKIFDPCVTDANLIHKLREDGNWTYYGLEPEDDDVIIQTSDLKNDIVWDVPHNMDNTLLVSFLHRLPQRIVRTNAVRDTFAASIVFDTLDYLKRGTFGMFLLPASFIKPHAQDSVYVNLSQNGVYVNALLLLPNNLFSDISEDVILFVVSNENHEQLFFGELSNIQPRNAVLIKNLIERRISKEFRLGYILHKQDFIGLHDLYEEQRARDLAEQYNLREMILSDLAHTVKINWTGEIGLDIDETTVLLPLDPSKPACVSVSDIDPEKPHINISINLDKALPLYVAKFLNTSLGRLVRRRIRVNEQTEITRTSVKRLPIFLPEIGDQISATEVDAKISELNSGLEELRTKLWSNPKSVEDVRQQLSMLRSEDIFDDWIKTLPYPLGSILWQYRANAEDYHKQYVYLLRFFEAFSEFTAAILLSATYKDAAVLTKPTVLNRTSVTKSTFGTWTRIIEDLSAQIRHNIQDPSLNYLLEDTFCTSVDVISKLTSTRLTNILNTTLELRNRWRGHGGDDFNSEFVQSRKVQLEKYLSDLRQEISLAFESYCLVRTISSTYSEGIHNNTVELLINNTPFRQKTIKTSIPLDIKKLYFHDLMRDKPLEAVPLIIVDSANDDNICYFFSTIEDKQTTYVCHHQSKPEKLLDSSELVAVFSALGLQME